MRKESFNHKVIRNPSRTYRYSFTLNFFLGVIILLCGALITSVLMMIFSDYLVSDSFSAVQKAVLILAAVLCGLPFYIWSVIVFVADFRIRKILKNGKRYEGEIVSYSAYGVYEGTEISREGKKRVALTVRYRRNKEHYCKADGYLINPDRALSGKGCSVYMYEGMIFVTDFNIRK